MHIAILEKDNRVIDFLKQILEVRYTVTIFTQSAALLAEINKQNFDFYILDWEITPLEVLHYIRETLLSPEPVIFLSQNYNERHLVEVLTAGADDYLIKMPAPEVLVARIKALERRAYGSIDQWLSRELHGYLFNTAQRSVSFADRTISLSVKEFELAYYFFCNFQRPLSRRQLFMAVWGREQPDFEYVFTRTLDVHVRFLRQKLNLGCQADIVKLLSIHGYGYRLAYVNE